MFFGSIGKTTWPPWPLTGWDIFNFSETAERNSTKLDRKQDLNVLYRVRDFQANRNNKMAALASDWLRHFRLLLWKWWTEFNETWQEARSQRPLPSLCFSSRFLKSAWRHSVYDYYDKTRNTPYFASWHLGDSLGVYRWPQCRYKRRFYKSHSRLSKITTGNRCRNIRTMQNVTNRNLIDPNKSGTWG